VNYSHLLGHIGVSNDSSTLLADLSAQNMLEEEQPVPPQSVPSHDLQVSASLFNNPIQ
jgi:hypothetical protein